MKRRRGDGEKRRKRVLRKRAGGETSGRNCVRSIKVKCVTEQTTPGAFSPINQVPYFRLKTSQDLYLLGEV